MLYPDLDDLVSLKDRKPPLDLSSNRSVKSTFPGDHHSPFRGQGLEFDSVREYVPGDDIRNIDWRVTARTGSPHMKIFREERERNVIVCIDMNATMRFGTRNTFKSIQAARAASLLSWRALGNHNRLGACLYGDVPNGMQFFAPKRTRKSLWAMLKTLTEHPSQSHHISLEEILQHLSKAAQTGSLIYVISDFMKLTENLERRLSRLNKRCDVVFIAVNDPADKAIHPVDTIAFCANNSEKAYVNTASIDGRRAYAAQWKENRQELQQIISRQKIAMVALTTESDVRRDLVLGLKSIARRRKQ